MENKTILITGCSSGIGQSTAKYFHEKGWNVIATVRDNPEKDTELQSMDRVLVTELDVTKEATIKSAVAKGIERFGKLMYCSTTLAMVHTAYWKLPPNIKFACNMMSMFLEPYLPLKLCYLTFEPIETA